MKLSQSSHVYLDGDAPTQRTPCNCRGCRCGIANGRAAYFRQDSHNAPWPAAAASRIAAPIIGARGHPQGHPRSARRLARERGGITANDILRAAGTVDAAEEEPNSEFVAEVVLPVLSAAEQEFGQALSRISLDDMVHRAASMATERVATKAA